MNMMGGLMGDLKPCPFCGREVSAAEAQFDRTGPTRIKVNCECGISFDIEAGDPFFDGNGNIFRPGPNAIDMWNRRAEDD